MQPFSLLARLRHLRVPPVLALPVLPVLALLALLALPALPRVASGQLFQWCGFEGCTTVSLTIVPPSPGTPPYYPGFPPPTLLQAHFVHDVTQLTVNDPVYGPIYLGPYTLSDAYYHPVFYPGGGSFYPGFIDDAPWLWGGTEMNTEGLYVLDDVHPIIGPGVIHGLVASVGGTDYRFTRLQTVSPEPGTVALVATGLLGVAGAAIRRRRGTR